MKKLLLPALAGAAALSLTSCFQSETVIHVKKDGSGTLVEETTFGEQMKAMMAQMASIGGGADGKAPADPMADMFSEEKMKAKAPKLGDGVSLDKVEKIPGKDGYRVTYKFADINKLKLNESDFSDNMKPPGAEEGKKEEPVTFTYAGGKLGIHMPKPEAKPKDDKDKDKEEEAAEEDGKEDPQEAAMKQVMADMKISIKVVADGGIDKTDATYNSGDTVTLMEIDFGKIVKNPDAMKKMKAAKPESPEDFEKALKGIDGIKMETKGDISVTLK